MIDFKNARELLWLCQDRSCLISDAMRQRECDLSERPEKQVQQQMEQVYQIMRQSALTPLHTPMKSMGGLIGGEAKKLTLYRERGENLCGEVLSRAIAYSMAVLEVNSSMGVIVAAPTAGSSGIVPGLLLAMQEAYHLSEGQVINALFNAGAIGYLAMRNATVAGAVGGCQAEVGTAAAMASSAAVELMGDRKSTRLNSSH